MRDGRLKTEGEGGRKTNSLNVCTNAIPFKKNMRINVYIARV